MNGTYCQALGQPTLYMAMVHLHQYGAKNAAKRLTDSVLVKTVIPLYSMYI